MATATKLPTPADIIAEIEARPEVREARAASRKARAALEPVAQRMHALGERVQRLRAVDDPHLRLLNTQPSAEELLEARAERPAAEVEFARATLDFRRLEPEVA